MQNSQFNWHFLSFQDISDWNIIKLIVFLLNHWGTISFSNLIVILLLRNLFLHDLCLNNTLSNCDLHRGKNIFSYLWKLIPYFNWCVMIIKVSLLDANSRNRIKNIDIYIQTFDQGKSFRFIYLKSLSVWNLILHFNFILSLFLIIFI